jgi:hypothetical protein
MDEASHTEKFHIDGKTERKGYGRNAKASANEKREPCQVALVI